MNKTIKDIIFIAALAVIILPFVFSDAAYQWYIGSNTAHPYLMAFAKFAILAIWGEMAGLRIKTGAYSYPGFGMAARMIVWGLFGIWIAFAMKVFAAGAPRVMDTLGLEGINDAMKGGFTYQKLIGAFSISFMLNTLFAPVFMTLHKITDSHIAEHKGSLKALITPIKMKENFVNLNWAVQWGFVFKKTIFLFWIPAHTITFLLPPVFQVLFAAALSIFLGLFLSIAAILGNKKA
ncbi:MAG: Mpv17/PMP22 family protein [Bacteroidales bacterium]